MKGKKLDVSKPQLPIRRQPSKHADEGQSDAHFAKTKLQDY